MSARGGDVLNRIILFNRWRSRHSRNEWVLHWVKLDLSLLLILFSTHERVLLKGGEKREAKRWKEYESSCGQLMGQTQWGHKNNSGGLVSVLQHLRAPAPVVSTTWGAFKNPRTWDQLHQEPGGWRPGISCFWSFPGSSNVCITKAEIHCPLAVPPFLSCSETYFFFQNLCSEPVIYPTIVIW